jgi:hypothetical protein
MLCPTAVVHTMFLDRVDGDAHNHNVPAAG